MHTKVEGVNDSLPNDSSPTGSSDGRRRLTTKEKRFLGLGCLGTLLMIFLVSGLAALAGQRKMEAERQKQFERFLSYVPTSPHVVIKIEELLDKVHEDEDAAQYEERLRQTLQGNLDTLEKAICERIPEQTQPSECIETFVADVLARYCEQEVVDQWKQRMKRLGDHSYSCVLKSKEKRYVSYLKTVMTAVQDRFAPVPVVYAGNLERPSKLGTVSIEIDYVIRTWWRPVSEENRDPNIRLACDEEHTTGAKISVSVESFDGKSNWDGQQSFMVNLKEKEVGWLSDSFQKVLKKVVEQILQCPKLVVQPKDTRSPES